jgi:hypothetical protein
VYLGAHRARIIETEQAVNVVNQHVEPFEEIFAQDALNMELPRSYTSTFESATAWEPASRESRCAIETERLNPAPAIAAVPWGCNEVRWPRTVNRGHLHSGIQEKVVGP